jgi:peptidoglycan/xylan/chitin deacetylase (PgdA/CDA1 family)
VISRRNILRAGLTGLLVERFPALSANALSNSDISHGSRTKADIALTFHGAGDINLANEILNIAKDSKTPITVMAVGNWLVANPNIGKTILQNGNDLGNHTYSHQAMLHLNYKSALSEIEKGKSALKTAVGSSQKYFRPSGTPKSNAIIRKAALASGYSNCITYDVDTMDYTDPKPDVIISNCMKTLKNGSIVSLHLGHKNTVSALPKLIETIKSAGFNPVTISNLLK